SPDPWTSPSTRRRLLASGPRVTTTPTEGFSAASSGSLLWRRRLSKGKGVSDLVLGLCGFAGSGRFPVFVTCPAVILAHSQTIADQGEKKDGHCEVHTSRRTSSTVSSPWPH